MKFMILVSALVLAGFAGQAKAASCIEGEVTYIGTGVYSGEGGEQEKAVVCHNGTFVPNYKPVTKHRGCIEGEVSYFPADNASSYGGEGGAPEVARTCHNGSFFPKAKAPVKYRSCLEGEITYVGTGVYSGEGGEQEKPVICRGGRFVNY